MIQGVLQLDEQAQEKTGACNPFCLLLSPLRILPLPPQLFLLKLRGEMMSSGTFNATVRGWTLATALGFCLAFLSFLLGQPIVEYFAPMPEAIPDLNSPDFPQHLDPNALPDWLDRPTYERYYRIGLIGHVIALFLFGVIVGSFQAYTLRRVLSEYWPWILASAAGFSGILLAELVRPHIVIGPHAGPFEPIMIAFGGGTLSGFFQWFYLRIKGISASKWLGLWMAGLVAGIVVSIGVIILFELLILPVIRQALPQETFFWLDWAIFLAIYGAGVGAGAGIFSGSALMSSLKAASAD